MVHLYARITEVQGPSGTTVRVTAPIIMRVAQALAFVVVAAIITIATQQAGSPGPPGFVAFFLVSAAVVYVAGWLQMRPFVAAGPEGLEARSSFATTSFRWEEVESVVWEHRFGHALSTRTEISVRRRGREDLQRVAVLHYLRGNILGAKQSTEIGARFLGWCRRYGASTRLGEGPMIAEGRVDAT
jgi:hypothetical protein